MLPTNIFRECGDLGIAGSWPILVPVEMGFRFVLGIGMFRELVLGIDMPRILVSCVGMVRRLDSWMTRRAESVC